MTDILNVKVNGEWVGIPAIKGENGQDGEGVPTGGTQGQALIKKSSTDFDAEWETLTASDVGALPDDTVIPIVNDGTLTIQVNNTDLQIFSANSSSDKTANILVPTDTSDLTNNAGFLKPSNLTTFTPMVDYYVSGSEGYVRWSNGYTIQWGRYGDGTGNTSGRVTFFLPFITPYYALTGNLLQSLGGSAYDREFPNTPDNSGFSFTYYTRRTYSWTASGFTSNWEQPTPTENGTLGGDTFAMYASNNYDGTLYPIYKSFDGNSSTIWYDSATPVDVIFYNPEALNVQSIWCQNRTDANNYAFTAGTVYGSKDNSTWTELKAFTNSVTSQGGYWMIDLSDNTNYYKYYKMSFTSATNNGTGANFYINANTENDVYKSYKE